MKISAILKLYFNPMSLSYAIWCHEQNGLLSKVGYSIENKVFYIIVYC